MTEHVLRNQYCLKIVVLGTTWEDDVYIEPWVLDKNPKNDAFIHGLLELIKNKPSNDASVQELNEFTEELNDFFETPQRYELARGFNYYDIFIYPALGKSAHNYHPWTLELIYYNELGEALNYLKGEKIMVTEELDVQNFKWDFSWDGLPYKIVNKYNPDEHHERKEAYSIYADLKFWSNLSKDPLRNDVYIMKNGEQLTYIDFLTEVKELLQKDIAETRQLLSDLAKPDFGGYTSGEYADQFDDDSYLRRPDGTEYESPTSTRFYGSIEWLRDSVIPPHLGQRRSTLAEVLDEIELIKGEKIMVTKTMALVSANDVIVIPDELWSKLIDVLQDLKYDCEPNETDLWRKLGVVGYLFGKYEQEVIDSQQLYMTAHPCGYEQWEKEVVDRAIERLQHELSIMLEIKVRMN